jgi:hypothetical protein
MRLYCLYFTRHASSKNTLYKDVFNNWFARQREMKSKKAGKLQPLSINHDHDRCADIDCQSFRSTASDNRNGQVTGAVNYGDQ